MTAHKPSLAHVIARILRDPSGGVGGERNCQNDRKNEEEALHSLRVAWAGRSQSGLTSEKAILHKYMYLNVYFSIAHNAALRYKEHMKTRNISLLLLSALFASTQAKAVDVFGKDAFFIQVTMSADKESAQFELCPKADKAHCQPLGKPDRHGNAQFYSLADLKAQATSEQLQIAGAVIGDIGAGVVLVYSGAFMGAIVVSGAGGAAVTGASAGALVGTSGTVVLAHVLDPLNPKEQWRQARMIRNDVITDQPVYLDAEVATYARSLDTVLKKLNPKF